MDLMGFTGFATSQADRNCLLEGEENGRAKQWIQHCSPFTVLNDELPYKNSTFKERFSRLNRLVLIMFEQDNVLVPRETSWFGYYSDGSFCEVLSRNQTTFYIEDWIGPRALDEAGKEMNCQAIC